VAKHFELVAIGKIKEILMDRIVTHIVKAPGNFDNTNMVLVPGPIGLDLEHFYHTLRYI